MAYVLAVLLLLAPVVAVHAQSNTTTCMKFWDPNTQSWVTICN